VETHDLSHTRSKEILIVRKGRDWTSPLQLVVETKKGGRSKTEGNPGWRWGTPRKKDRLLPIRTAGR